MVINLTLKTNIMIYSIYYPVLLTDGEYHEVRFSAEFSEEDNGLEDRTYLSMCGKVQWAEELYNLQDNNEIRKASESLAVKEAFDVSVKTGKEFFEI
jgi:hypothetical protein